MTVTDIKAAYIVDAKSARCRILDAVKRYQGNVSGAADGLGCSYHTLWRLIKNDPALDAMVQQLRSELSDEGVGQRGWKREQ